MLVWIFMLYRKYAIFSLSSKFYCSKIAKFSHFILAKTAKFSKFDVFDCNKPSNFFVDFTSTSTKHGESPLYMRVFRGGSASFHFHLSSTFSYKTTCFVVKEYISWHQKDNFFESKTSCFVLKDAISSC